MKCEHCKRKAVIHFSPEPNYAFTHGFGLVWLCRQCYIKELEEAVKAIRKNIAKQKKGLRGKK